MTLQLVLTVVIAVAVIIAARDIHMLLLRSATIPQSRDDAVPFGAAGAFTPEQPASPLRVQPANAKWEYVIASTKWHGEQRRFNIFLNGSIDEWLSACPVHDSIYVTILSALGERGWELVSVVPPPES